MNPTNEPISIPGPKSPASRLATELGPMFRLALPVVVAELGWMAMGLVDAVIVGPLGKEATGAVGLGNNLYIASAIFGLGLLLGLDAMVSREHGAGEADEARRSLAQGVYLAAMLTPATMLLVWGLVPLLPSLGLMPEVLRAVVPYLKAVTWGTAPLLIFAAFRRYLQAVDVVKPITFALVSANVVNAAVGWSLVHGRFGLPALGVEGTGWATAIARSYLAAVLILAFLRYAPRPANGANPFRNWPKPEPARLRRLVCLGLPAALQVTLEVGVFAAATTLAGRLDAASLAAHNIALNVSSLTFMVPLGISAAGAIRVGQALGRCDPRGSATSGWAALLIGSGFMAASGLTMLVAAGPVIGVFTGDPSVIATATRLFVLAAAFQLFDGLQVVATGVLRGAGDTRTPMVVNLVAHWSIGLPIGSLLAFGLGFGIVGLWVGLSIGLGVAGLVNLAVWARKARGMDAVDLQPGGDS